MREKLQRKERQASAEQDDKDEPPSAEQNKIMGKDPIAQKRQQRDNQCAGDASRVIEKQNQVSRHNDPAGEIAGQTDEN